MDKVYMIKNIYINKAYIDYAYKDKICIIERKTG